MVIRYAKIVLSLYISALGQLDEFGRATGGYTTLCMCGVQEKQTVEYQRGDGESWSVHIIVFLVAY
jgi:hypothetical protein